MSAVRWALSVFERCIHVPCTQRRVGLDFEIICKRLHDTIADCCWILFFKQWHSVWFLYLGQVVDRWPDPEVLVDLVLVDQVHFRHCSAFRANHVWVYMHVGKWQNTQFLQVIHTITWIHLHSKAEWTLLRQVPLLISETSVGCSISQQILFL